MNAAVIGGGSWGSAFSLYLSRLGVPTRLWIREPEILETARKLRENKTFLPGFKFPPAVVFSRDIGETIESADWIFIAVPSEFCRDIYSRIAPPLREEQAVISLTKGLEKKTLMRMSEVMTEIFRPYVQPRIGVLSGPSFSREVAEKRPTALVLASAGLEWPEKVQHRLSSTSLRIYTSPDVVGVELAGALKNVIAIAAGISDGLGFGDNARAALVTRGLAEITRLGVKLKASEETFSGLAGMGDLVLTCTGRLSRNRHVGEELARGKPLSEIVGRTRMVAEGIVTCRSARELAARESVEMPILEQVYRILYQRKDPQRALKDLMNRALKSETNTQDERLP
jgi:glycerol-3-phosphate dehydrogenase (NAD(P)+)